MPEGMPQGINLDPQVLITVMNERIAAGAIREARLTAAVQQLTMENMKLNNALTRRDDLFADKSPDGDRLDEEEGAIVEEEDASTS